MKIWRPRIHSKSVSVNREGKFFALNCRTNREADAVQKAVVSTLIKERKR